MSWREPDLGSPQLPALAAGSSSDQSLIFNEAVSEAADSSNLGVGIEKMTETDEVTPVAAAWPSGARGVVAVRVGILTTFNVPFGAQTQNSSRGCSASSRAMLWAPDGSFVVVAPSNVVVSAAGADGAGAGAATDRLSCSS
jgi:hypothetical protein